MASIHRYTKAQIKRLLKIDFVRFCIVGGTGFVINLILLTLFHTALALPVFLAQLFASEIALFSNFLLHHHWTYKDRTVLKTKQRLLIEFHASSWPAIIGSAVMVTACEKFLHFGSVLALVTSSAIALFWNFAWSKYVIWRGITRQEVEEIAEQ
jgi:putative flippase GtrA